MRLIRAYPGSDDSAAMAAHPHSRLKRAPSVLTKTNCRRSESPRRQVGVWLNSFSRA